MAAPDLKVLDVRQVLGALDLLVGQLRHVHREVQAVP